MKNGKKIIVISVLSAVALFAQDQETAETAPVETLDMGVMLVQEAHAQLTQPSDRVAIVDTITRAQIERSMNTNLLDLLGTMPGVQKKIDCSVCKTAHIRLLGLGSGYSQILINGLPVFSGLGNIYGIEQIPLVNIENILVMRGASSVRHGNSAIAGVVDIIQRPIPRETQTYFRAMYSNFNEQYYDAFFSKFIDETKTGVEVALNYTSAPRINTDGIAIDKLGTLMDNSPEFDRVAISMRLTQEVGQNTQLNANAQVSFEDRFGGTSNSDRRWIGVFQPESSFVDNQGNHRHRPIIYQEYARTRRVNYGVGSKTQITPSIIPAQSIVNENRVNFIQHYQESWYGFLTLEALQNMVFGVSDFTFNFDRNQLLAGVSFTYDQFEDNRSLGTHLYTIPAVYLQNTFLINDYWDFSAGARYDFHNVHGSIFSPRFAVNFSPDHHWNFMATAGKGFRTFNLFSENHAAITSALYIVDSTSVANLRPETAWSVALNARWSQFWLLNLGMATEITVFQAMISDYIQPYYSRFTTGGRQIVSYQNLDGTAITRGVEGLVRFILPRGFTVDAGTNFTDFDSRNQTSSYFAYYSPRVSALSRVLWEPRRTGLALSADWNYTGSQRLREVRFGTNVVLPQRHSEPFSVFNAQIDKTLGRWTFSASCQNIGDFYQQSIEPVFHHEGDFYLSTSVWAPVRGRTFWFGIRFNG
ncbi:MAG: TonB-dependent receptor [Chitinivibrionia bacterium]|nr:TonB-dependent receptor [Chitinivibrionia bacterium]